VRSQALVVEGVAAAWSGQQLGVVLRHTVISLSPTAHMASHTISFKLPEKLVLAKDVEFEVKSNGTKLGKLLVSQGNIEWVPANNSVKKKRLTWEKFAT
jgi:hypothetical protein